MVTPSEEIRAHLNWSYSPPYSKCPKSKPGCQIAPNKPVLEMSIARRGRGQLPLAHMLIFEAVELGRRPAERRAIDGMIAKVLLAVNLEEGLAERRGNLTN
jgi:hypothetical protein